ncbi:MAG: hypothetical protein RQ760_14645 [Sedimentisphaerales bacterium]|nr:hypothetical protein [Sedimentisphaerales bacterium]
MADRNALGRRDSLKNAAGATVGVMGCPCIVVSSALGNADTVPPSERIAMGCIGPGWQGGSNMHSFLREKDCQIAVICDVDKNHPQGADNRVNSPYKNKDCAAYADYRELLGSKIRFNPQTKERLDDQTATSLLEKSVCSPWHL